MAPAWDDEDSDSTPPTSPPQIAVRRSKFDDEEDDDDVADNWEEEDDSEAEREKAKKAAEAKAKAEAEAAAAKKSKKQRIEEHRNQRLQQRLAEEDDDTSDEDEMERRRIAKEQEKAGDLKHAEDLFGDLTGPAKRSGNRPVVAVDPHDPANNVDLTSFKIFNPSTKADFTKLREALVPLINAHSKKGHYVLFLQDLARGLCAELPSDQVKKVSTVLTTLSNEKMREEKAAEKGGKKTKAQQTKAKLSAGRDVSFKADTTAYDDDGLDDGDFM